MARKKRISDTYTSIRRRAQRALNRFLKIGDQDSADSIKSYIESSKEHENEKGRRRELTVRAKSAIEALNAMFPGRAPKVKDENINQLAISEMKLASKNESGTFVGEYGKTKMRIFMVATQDIWNKPGIAPDKRLEAVAKYASDHGKTIIDAFNEVMKQSYESLEGGVYEASGVAWPSDLYTKNDIDYQTSPDYLKAVYPWQA